MTDTVTRTAPKRLSTLDKWLPLWIGLAMVAGLLLGRFVPVLSDVLSAMEVGGISVPIGLGLLVMMYPVLAKVRYDKVAAVTEDKKLLVSSLVLNWLVGPAVSLLVEIEGEQEARDAFPKPLTDDAVRAADVVVTMGCGDVCPIIPGVRYEDWAVGDPALASPQGVDAIRHDIESRVRALLATLTD